MSPAALKRAARESVSGLPREFWWLWTSTLVNRLGAFVATFMALYLTIALLSIKPTVSFLRWRRQLAESGALPPAAEIAAARRLIHVEVALLALMPLLAVLMARGIGR